MRLALHAEWTKARTVAGTAWLLVAVVALTVGLSALTSSAGGADPAKVGLTGVVLGQAIVAILAVSAMSGEYGTGMIAVTLAAVPRRWVALCAKGCVIAGLSLAAGVVAVLGAVLAARALLPDGLSLAGPVLRAALGSVLYLGLVALLSLGVATIVRDAASAIGVVLGLLYLFPIVAALVSDPDWYRRLQQIAPMTAGLSVQATVDVANQPLAPWAGLGVLGAWAAGALLVGGVVLRSRGA